MTGTVDGPAGRSDRSGRGRLRVAVVDDHEVFRLGLRSLLQRSSLEVVWDTGSVPEAFELCNAQPVDVVLMDVNLGGPVDGLEATRRLTARQAGLRVILMSGLVDERRLAAARHVGAVGFLPKELGAAEMVSAIHALVDVGVPAGEPSGTGRRPARLEPIPAGAEQPFAALTPREVEVLGEIRLGRTNREIAAALGVSTTTVNKHVHQVLRKLRIRNRAEAATLAGRLLSLPRRAR